MVAPGHPKEVPEYACRVIAESIEMSGFPYFLSEEPHLDPDDDLVMATPERPYHLLVYAPGCRAHQIHLLVNASYKVRRLFALPPDARFIPAWDPDRRLPAEDESEMPGLMLDIPMQVAHDLSQLLYQGLARQVTRMPTDIRIERDIAAELPEHAERQRGYFLHQLENLEGRFAPGNEQIIPARMYAAASAMNIAFASEIAEISDLPLSPVFGQSPHNSLGERLRQEVGQITDTGYAGDRSLTDRWAELLGMRDWYEWTRLGSA